jgi:hypothetical protein
LAHIRICPRLAAAQTRREHIRVREVWDVWDVPVAVPVNLDAAIRGRVGARGRPGEFDVFSEE